MGWFRRKKQEEPEPPSDWMVPRDELPVYDPPATFEQPVYDAPPLPEPEPVTGVIFLDNGDIHANVSTVPEAKLAIKQLRLRKKELGLEKKEISAEMAAIRAERSQAVAKQGPMMRGGGNFGKMIRGFESAGRQSSRSSHANRLAPYQDLKAGVDRRIIAVDTVIHQLEAYILENSDSD